MDGFQIARFKRPQDAKLRVVRPGNIPFNIDIPNCNNTIVYIRITSREAEPIYEVMTF